VAGDELIHEIRGDELHRYTNAKSELPSLAEARGAILAARDDPFVPTPENPAGVGCGWSPYSAESLAESSLRAALAVHGTFGQQVGDVIELHVKEYLRGEGPQTLKVNARHLIADGPTCLTGMATASAYRPGQEVLAFLGPDAFGLGADWRPVGQGQAILAVEGSELDAMPYFWEGVPTLTEVRARLGPGRAPTTSGSVPAAEGAPAAGGGDQNVVLLLAALGAFVVLGTALFAWRTGWRRR
jgi:hypothetical protein